MRQEPQPMEYAEKPDPQMPLVDVAADWQAEWQDMPEFVQAKLEPFCYLTVRFRSQEDLDDFADRMGQALTPKTKSIWHPPLDRTSLVKDKRYVCG